MAPQKVVLSFTGGKDSTLVLHILSKSPELYNVALLCTFVPAKAKPFLSHKLELIQAIAKAVGVPHRVLVIDPGQPAESSENSDAANQSCATATGRNDFLSCYVAQMQLLKSEGIEAFANGDIEDVCSDFMGKAARAAGLPLVRPLWEVPRPKLLAQLYDEFALKFIVTCVNSTAIPREVAALMLGRVLTKELLAHCLSQPGCESVDQCGENGEFHTMVLDGPLYQQRINIPRGKITESEGGLYLFWDFSDFSLKTKDGRS
ncbi:uncharacterized protein EV422DRAFT_317996 [Fimicolochytrium jonesii]|uniref:uncharacterized protein n=1 Tax=Fimicolochytrium jonesii TaxID=1396493 RepID=UPI0022FF0315|nr:uncharacterized protein EV422DRAFT_317996 [Fimicolochytrium jonesii]KAI8824363.1 hypothetical protein EV422DRAFT_317996 [Fimicolochytrium jonesii]